MTAPSLSYLWQSLENQLLYCCQLYHCSNTWSDDLLLIFLIFVFVKELMEHFHPVFRHFFLERFPDPAIWFERRLTYTRGVATSSIGIPYCIFSECLQKHPFNNDFERHEHSWWALSTFGANVKEKIYCWNKNRPYIDPKELEILKFSLLCRVLVYKFQTLCALAS